MPNGYLLDNSFTTTNYEVVGVYGANFRYTFQPFEAEEGWTSISKVYVTLCKGISSSGGTATMDIYLAAYDSVSGRWLPSGGSLKTKAVSFSNIPTSSSGYDVDRNRDDVCFNFTSLELTAGNVYVIRLKSNAQYYFTTGLDVWGSGSSQPYDYRAYAENQSDYYNGNLLNWSFRLYGNMSYVPDDGSGSTDTFPPERPPDYDEEEVWEPDPTDPPVDDAGYWTDPSALTALGGGRYNKQLVVLGHKKIYFGEI